MGMTTTDLINASLLRRLSCPVGAEGIAPVSSDKSSLIPLTQELRKIQALECHTAGNVSELLAERIKNNGHGIERTLHQIKNQNDPRQWNLIGWARDPTPNKFAEISLGSPDYFESSTSSCRARVLGNRNPH